MRTTDEILEDLRPLQAELQEAQEAERVRARAEELLSIQSFKEREGIEVSISDEHATLSLKKEGLEFYFGADETWCPKHLGDWQSCEDDCDTEWSLTVRKDGNTLLHVPHSQMDPALSYDDIAECLLCGIGMWLRQKLEVLFPAEQTSS